MSVEAHIGKHAKHAKVCEPVVELDEGLDDAALELPMEESADQAEPVEPAEPTESIEPVEPVELTESAALAETANNEGGFVSEEDVEESVEEATEAIEAIGEAVEIEESVEGGEALEGTEEATGFVPAFDVATEKKSGKVLKGIGIGLGVLVGIVAIVYVAGIAVFSNWFLPQTTVGPIDVSLKTSEEAVQLIDDYIANYKLDIVGGTFSYRATADKLGLATDSQSTVKSMHNELEAWKWPVLLFEGAHDESDCLNVGFLETLTASGIKEAVVKFNENATPPQDAYVEYDEKTDSFIVQPEVDGTQYEPVQVALAAEKGIRSLSPKVQLEREQLVQPKVLATDERLIKAADDATKMISAHISLSLEGIPGGEIGPDQLHDLVSVTPEFEATIDEDVLYDWAITMSDGYNTVGTERTYTRPDGKVITISGGAYGWEVDTYALCDEILEAIRKGGTTQIEVPCSMVGEAWNGFGEVDWGNRYIDVDLSEQYVRFYNDDAEIIWESDCITGAPDGIHNTVEGVWYVTGLESPSKLVGWENGKKIYETYVRWWMPFEGNGIGFHDADWQPAFGGYMYASGYGSHGCVNLPVYKAEELWYIIEVDDVVIVHW